MEISRRKRLVRRITERLKRKPKKDRHKMPEQNLPEFPVQSQNPELTGDLTSVEETSPDDTKATEEVEMVTSNEKLMKDLPPEGRKTLVELLQPLKPFGKDYRGLADCLGFDAQFIGWLESTNEPVVRLLTHIESIKITKVISHLEKMGRQDAAEDLRQFEELTHSPGELEEHKKRIDTQGPPQTLCEEYDVFICYAPPDKPFADEVLRKLEQWPYCFKVCIDYRDFLPGSGCNQLELSAKAIEQKCKKVLVIMSENLTNYAVTDFQAKVALSLSPVARTRILIPIKYKPCTVPPWLRHLFYLDYTTEEARLHFWKKLLMSLGYKDSSS